MSLVRNSFRKFYLFWFLIVLLVSVFSGCGPEEQKVFEFSEETDTNKDILPAFSFALQTSSNPVTLEPNSLVSEEDLADGSIFYSVSHNNESANRFRLNIHAKNITNLADVPITLQYDPKLIRIGDSRDQNGPTAGDALISKQNEGFLPANGIVVYGTNSRQESGKYLITLNVLDTLSYPHNQYNGVLCFLFVNTITPNTFDTNLGFVTESSDVLDPAGNSIQVNYYGGTLSKNQ